jgi:very-short-patch-repair endonuclease
VNEQQDFHISIVARARKLRREASHIEGRVWRLLRNGHVDGWKFRRQHPIGKYVVDSYCHSHRLVIEIDGPSHDDRHDHDTERTLWLNQNGYRVIRFTNLDVLRNPKGVREAIKSACSDAGPLTRPVPPVRDDLSQRER